MCSSLIELPEVLEEQIRVCQMKIKMSQFMLDKIEKEILEIVEEAITILKTIKHGLRHRNPLAIESDVFYKKLYYDMYRYKIQIY